VALMIGIHTEEQSELSKDLEASLMLVKLRRIANRLSMEPDVCPECGVAPSLDCPICDGFWLDDEE
jgi:predicted Zn-ribbon and HTH transcriptional regulator